MKNFIYFLFFISFSSILAKSEATKINCNFITITLATAGSLYTCQVTNNLNITSLENAVIESVNGTHKSEKTNDDVMAFHADRKEIEYFPAGLEKFFKNLEAFYMPNNKIKQIDQSNLKPFPNLIFLDINNNFIEFIEDGLFENHSEMTLIFLNSNKIVHVGKNVFNNMKNISWFNFNSNPCISMETRGNSTAVPVIIENLKLKCFDETFANFSQNLLNLEDESKTLTFETFPNWKENLENLETEFKNSTFSYLLSIKRRFEILNELKIDDFTTQSPVTTTANPDDCMSSNFENLENNLSELFTKSLNQTENNLKNVFIESCMNNDEFMKNNEKVLEQPSILTRITNLEENINTLAESILNIEDKLGKILDAIANNGN